MLRHVYLENTRLRMKHGPRVLRSLLYAWLLVPPALACIMAWEAIGRWWSPPAPGVDPFFDSVGRPHETFYSTAELRTQLALAMVVAVACFIPPVVRLVLCVTNNEGSTGARRRMIDWSLVLVAFSPVVSRLIIPAEDPYTGAGSPLAVLISLLFGGAFFGVLFAMPAFALAVSSKNDRLVPASATRQDSA
jgi:hypothetical protein